MTQQVIPGVLNHRRRRHHLAEAESEDPKFVMLHGSELPGMPKAPSVEDLGLAEEARGELASEMNPIELGVAAGVAELLASRAGQAPPSWVDTVEATPTPVCLVKAARTMPRLRRLCEEEGPEPLRRRGILAPPEFLKVT